MQYTFVKACLLALAATTSVTAQIAGFDVITAPTPDEVIQAGTTYTIKWEPSAPAGPISLRLMEGTSNITLNYATGFIAQSIDSTLGQFDWDVPADATAVTYGIRLQLDSDPDVTFQFSNHFSISGGTAGGSSTGSSVTGGSTQTVQVSQVSTPTPTPSKSSTQSSSAKPTPTKESSSTSVESTTAAPSSTEAPSTTMSTSVVPPSSTEAPSTTPIASPTASPTGAANSNAVVGSGLLGAMVMVFALF